MTYVHLQGREYYEDLYDHHTVEDARRGMVHYDKFILDFAKKLPKDEKIDRPGNAIVLNAFFMQAVGEELLYRYENRDKCIREWIRRDEAKDKQISEARLAEEPYCHHCSKQGLRIIDKSLMHRSDNAKFDDSEEVLFMLRCPHCDMNSAFWEDGTAWEPKPTLCPKCKAEMTDKTTRTKKAITFTYTCPSCNHSYKDKMDLGKQEKEEPDPDYDKDRIHFTLADKEFRDKLYAVKDGFEHFAELSKQFKEKEDNKHIYDSVAEIKKPKIAELVPLLAEPLEKAGYIEFSLDKPEIGREVVVGFSCLDNKSGRSDYDSRHDLKKLIDKTLIDTNWRLMSDGIHYRLGYLSGRIKAYEGEEDLKKLVMKTKNLKPKTSAGKPSNKDVKDNAWKIKGKNAEDILL